MSTKRVLNALLGNKNDTIPCWFMRQAGRSLPEYLAIKEKMKTYDMFQTPSVASEVTLQPLKRFPLDAAIVYADILHIPDVLGCGLSFVKGDGPKFEKTVSNMDDVIELEDTLKNNRTSILEKLSFIQETLTLVKPQLESHQTLIGFAGAPWTVGSYVIEGGSTKTFIKTKRFMLEQPEAFKKLMAVLTDLTKDYLQGQIKAGADCIQLFESWGGNAVSPNQYKEFIAPYVTDILTSVQQKVPTIHFVNKSAGVLDEALKVPSSAFGVDYNQKLDNVTQHSSLGKRAIQGNLDPITLFADWNRVEKEAKEILEIGAKHPHGFIFNVGHGFSPETPLENVAKLVDYIHAFKS